MGEVPALNPPSVRAPSAIIRDGVGGFPKFWVPFRGVL